MTHDELITYIDDSTDGLKHEHLFEKLLANTKALRAVVELHTPSPIPDWVPTKEELMCWCAHIYPCPTIQAIEKELE
jgi:hypothetical protein